MIYYGNVDMSCSVGVVGGFFDFMMVMKFGYYNGLCSLLSDIRFEVCVIGDLIGMLGSLDVNIV